MPFPISFPFSIRSHYFSFTKQKTKEQVTIKSKQPVRTEERYETSKLVGYDQPTLSVFTKGKARLANKQASPETPWEKEWKSIQSNPNKVMSTNSSFLPLFFRFWTTSRRGSNRHSLEKQQMKNELHHAHRRRNQPVQFTIVGPYIQLRQASNF